LYKCDYTNLELEQFPKFFPRSGIQRFKAKYLYMAFETGKSIVCLFILTFKSDLNQLWSDHCSVEYLAKIDMFTPPQQTIATMDLMFDSLMVVIEQSDKYKTQQALLYFCTKDKFSDCSITLQL
jgi:hypothetical protein